MLREVTGDRYVPEVSGGELLVRLAKLREGPVLRGKILRVQHRVNEKHPGGAVR